jgi:hypothetical protein
MIEDIDGIDAKVVIPWRHEATRAPGLRWLRDYYAARFGAANVHIERDRSRAPFNKAAVQNAAVRRFPGSVVVIADADCLVCDWVLGEAIRHAAKGRHLIIPHNRVCRMNPAQSAELLATSPASRISGKMHAKQRTGPAPSGLIVVAASLYLRYEMDERFYGWGAEDTEFLRRIPHRRFTGPLFHIWHEPAPREYFPRNLRMLARARRSKWRPGMVAGPAPKVDPNHADRVPIAAIEYHAIDGCNLACRHCAHFSDIVRGGMRTADHAREEFATWSPRIAPRRVAILGGEPTLNPQLSDILRAAADAFPLADLSLVTNGFRLDKHPGLRDLIADLGVDLQVSQHAADANYRRHFAPVAQLLREWSAARPDLRYAIRKSWIGWRESYRLVDGKAYPHGTGDAAAGHRACIQSTCHQLYAGRLWKCPPLAHFANLERALNLEDLAEWQSFRDYKSLGPDCSRADLEAFAINTPIPQCGLCPARVHLIPIGQPLRPTAPKPAQKTAQTQEDDTTKESVSL